MLRAQKHTPAEIGRRLGRHPSTIAREITRNSQRGRPDRYRASSAQANAVEPGADRPPAAGGLPRR